MILMSQYLFLLHLTLLGVLIPIPTESVVYYVAPTEHQVSDCPGEPCQTLNYYLFNEDSYFSSDKISITMVFLPGNHTTLPSYGVDLNVKNLDTLRMEGMKSPTNIRLASAIRLTNVSKINIEMLSLSMVQPLAAFHILALTEDHVLSISKTSFSGVALYHSSSSSSLNIVLVNTTFKDKADITFISGIWTPSTSRFYSVAKCSFQNLQFFIQFDHIKFSIEDSSFLDIMGSGIELFFSTVKISGNVLVSSFVNDLAVLLSEFSNISIVGNVTFSNCQVSVITSFSSTITLSGNISFLNNTGIRGGAMALYSTTLNIARNTNVYFFNNVASETGGAIHVDTNEINYYPAGAYMRPCFYQLLDYVNDSNLYSVHFKNNLAKHGGDHLYGEYMHSDFCWAATAYSTKSNDTEYITSSQVQDYFIYDSISSMSQVSSDPIRACICEDEHTPHCTISKIGFKVHPGECFTLLAVVVGADFGTTVGTVYGSLDPTTSSVLKPSNQYAQGITNNEVCSQLRYTIFSKSGYEVMYLTSSSVSFKDAAKSLLGLPGSNVVLHVSVTLQDCPLGFTLLGDPPGCDCYPVLTENGVNCKFINGTGYLLWNVTMWMDITTDENATSTILFIAHYCPFDFCTSIAKAVSFQDDSNIQCNFNHAGRLCGGCKNNYSLAIGSSHLSLIHI